MKDKKFRATIYRDPATSVLDEEELSDYLEKKLSLKTRVKKALVERISEEKIGFFSEMFASARVRDIGEKLGEREPNFGEKRFEKRLLKNPSKDVKGILYDAKKLEEIYLSLLSEEERNKNHFAFVLTNRLFGTFGNDNRYHARVSLYGFPILVSPTGLVEAPAKPKEFYRKKRSSNLETEKAIKEEISDDFLDYGEKRITEAMKGYLLQGVFYQLGRNPFCEETRCRFYDAHWQSELLEAQLEEPEFCEKHSEKVREIRELF